VRRASLIVSLFLCMPYAGSAQSKPPNGGPDAAEVKRCLEALKDPDPLKRARAAEDLGAMWPPAKEAIEPLAGLLRDGNLEVRRAAAQALSGFGPDAQKVVPALIDAIGDEDASVSISAGVAVKLAGKGSVEPLRKALGRKEARIRSMAALLLGDFGEDAKAALPDLERLLEDPDEHLRQTSARSFAQLGGRSAVAARILCESLGADPAALDGVKLVASQGELAVPILIDMLSKGSPEAKSAACWALERIGRKAKDGVPALGKALADDVQGVRRAAAGALGAIGPDAIETLAKGLKDEDAGTREACAWSFAAMAKAFGKDARPAVPFLEAILGDKAERVRKGAQQALDILKKE